MADTTSSLSVQNGFSTTLTTTVSTTDTIFYLASLPTGSQGFLTIDEGLSSQEIIFYTSKGSNFVQLTSIAQGRGQDGTSASGHTAGAVVKQKTNAGYWKALQDGTALGISSVTTPQYKPSQISKVGSTGSNFTTTSASYVAVTGTSVTYTTGSTAERLFLWYRCLAQLNAAANAVVALSVATSGVSAQTPGCYVNGTTTTPSLAGFITFDALASTTYTIQLCAKTDANTLTINFNSADWVPIIKGFAISNV